MANVLLVATLATVAPSTAQAQSAAEVDALNDQVVQLYNQGKNTEAIPVAERALALAEQALGNEHPATLTSASNLGDLYRALGRYNEAEPLYLRALEARGRTLGKEDPSTLTSANNLAQLYRAQGRYGEAELLYRRALEARERTLGKEHSDTLSSINNLAVLYSDQGVYREAETLHRRALEARERTLGKEHLNTLASVNNLAVALEVQGQYDEAESLYRRALEARERILGKEHPNTLSSANNLAILYSKQGRFDDAEPIYKRVLEARERQLGRDHPSTLSSINNLASFYSIQSRYGEAEPLYKRALEAQERVLGKEHPDTLLSVNNLAAVYSDQNRHDEAEPLHKRALEAQERVLGEAHISTLISVNNLAKLYKSLGRYSEAELLYERAVQASERALGKEHPLTLASLNNLAALYSKQGRFGEAEPLFQRTLELRERVLGREHPDTLASANDLAFLYFEQRDWNRAAQFWRRNTGMIAERTLRGAQETGLALTGKKKSETVQKSGQFLGLIKAVQRLAPENRPPEALLARETFETAQWATGSEAAMSLAQMAARGAKGDPNLAELARERQDLVAEWQRRDGLRNAALVQPPGKRNGKAEAENLARLTAIDTRIAAIDKRMEAEFPDYAALASPAPLSVEETQAQLGADEALVLFLDSDDKFAPTPEETFIWVVTRRELRWVRSDLGKQVLIREVQALRCGLDAAAWDGQRCAELTGQNYTITDEIAGRPLPFDLLRAHELYKALFGQAEDLIKGKHLLIVPSGALTQLPFQVLVTTPPASGEYRSAEWLARGHALTVLPAVSSLKALRRVSRPSAAAKPLIGFGNPLLNGPNDRYAMLAQRARDNRSCRNEALEHVAALADVRRGTTPVETRVGIANLSQIRSQPPLPETADELCAVARDVGADFAEIRLGARATEQEVKALSASGALAQFRIVHFATHGAMAGELNDASEPGLILTPPATASAEDDGYLTGSEIAGLKLDADWVILSACNTAAGAASDAEALSGLARAFIYAQARALLVSHWAVDSNATVKLVSSAMDEIARQRGTVRAEALRRAMLALIDRGEPREAHPAYWAPFVVVGEGGR